jgi:hypothetical protein
MDEIVDTYPRDRAGIQGKLKRKHKMDKYYRTVGDAFSIKKKGNSDKN